MDWTGGWPRYAPYHVWDGFIEHDPRAASQPYDPWEDLDLARPGRGGKGRGLFGGTLRPYSSLFYAVSTLEESDSMGRHLTPKDHPFARFANEFGLLGGDASRDRQLLRPDWVPGPYYSESLGYFTAAAVDLRTAVNALAEDPQKGLPLLQQRAAGRWTAVPTQPQGEYTLGWDASSLISTYALMILRDFVTWGPPRACAWCRNPFLSGAPQARYCSVMCRFKTHNAARRLGAMPEREPELDVE